MPPRKARLHGGRLGAALTVRVMPRAARNAISGILSDGTVKVQITAAPVDGEANANLIAFLAKALDVPRTSIDIIAGATGRNKLISFIGIDAATLHQRVLAAMR